MSLTEDLASVMKLIDKAASIRLGSGATSGDYKQLRDAEAAVMQASLTFFRTHAPALAEMARDNVYLRWRMNEIMPLFEEARDALVAIPLASAKLHRIDLSLAARMDAAGIKTQTQIDAALAALAHQPGSGDNG